MDVRALSVAWIPAFAMEMVCRQANGAHQLERKRRDENESTDLLFHRFVNSDLVRDVHLVELVDSADAVVRQHQRAGFDGKLARLFVLDDGGRETCRGGSLAGGVDGTRQEAADVSVQSGRVNV
jgi:hypothetical protein